MHAQELSDSKYSLSNGTCKVQSCVPCSFIFDTGLQVQTDMRAEFSFDCNLYDLRSYTETHKK